VCCSVLLQCSHTLYRQPKVHQQVLDKTIPLHHNKVSVLQRIVAVQPHVVQTAKSQKKKTRDKSILLNHYTVSVMLQCVAVCCCSVLLQCVAVCCCSHDFVTSRSSCMSSMSILMSAPQAPHCNALQRTATHCNILMQHTATRICTCMSSVSMVRAVLYAPHCNTH